MTALLLALAFVATAAIALPMLSDDKDRRAMVEPTASATSIPAPTASAGAIVPATPAAVPTGPPPFQPTPQPPRSPIPEPTPRPTPEPTPRSTPEPTPRPTPEPTPRPAVQEVRVRIPDRLFQGDYDGRGSGRYHGRTASWVYGQGTPHQSMTARFRIDTDGRIGRRASLTIVGIDGENERKNRIAVVLNSVMLYEGPNPLPNDHCCGSSGPGNWDSVAFRVPGEILRRNNELTISNLEPGDCIFCPNFVMVDKAALEYRLRPD